MKRSPLLLFLLLAVSGQAQTQRDTVFYPSGKIRTITITRGTSTEQRDYYENGRLQSEQFRRNGERDGDYKQYTSQGKLSYSCTYSAGLKEGKEIACFPDGSVRKLSTYKIVKDGAPSSLLDGEQKEYKNPGQLSYSYHYKDNKKHGLCEEWFDDGKKKNSVEYAGGYRKGKCYYWAYNGRLTFDGQMDTATVRKSNGSLAVEEVKTGYCRSFSNATGLVTEEGLYQKGKREGLHKKYYETGKTESEIVYHDDLVAGKVMQWYKNGQLRLSAEQYADRETRYKVRYEGPFEEYDENGHPKSKGNYKNGKKTGPWKHWSGETLTVEEEYDNGLLTGKRTTYHAKTGKPSRTEFHVRTRVNGRDTSLLDGEVNNYHETGTLVRKDIYKMGVLQVNNTKEFTPGGQLRLEYVNEGDRVRRIEYNENGTKKNESVALKQDGKEPDYKDFKTTHLYDMNGRLRSEIHYDGTRPAGLYSEYNAEGKITGEALLFHYTRDYGLSLGNIDNAWNAMHYMNGAPWKENYIRSSWGTGYEIEWYITGKLKRVVLVNEYDAQWLSNGELMSLVFFKDRNPNTLKDTVVPPGFAADLYKRFSRSKNKMLQLTGVPDGWQRSYYDEKQVRFEVCLHNGRADSAFRGYYPDGRLFVEWPLRDGLPHGTYRLMNSNGTEQESGQFDRGRPYGVWKQSSPTGVPYAEYEMDTSGAKNAVTYRKEFYPLSGKIKSVTRYRNGKRHGLQQTWAENGTLTLEYSARNDSTVGEYRSWNDQGQLTRHTQYDDRGRKNGIDAMWTWRGVPQYEQHYVNNKQEGEMRNYWPNGKLRSLGYYRNGEADGTWELYDSLGRRQPDVKYTAGTRQTAPDPNPCACNEQERKVGFAPLVTSLVDTATFTKWQFRFHQTLSPKLLNHLFYMDYQNSYSQRSRFNSLTLIAYQPIEIGLPDSKGLTLLLNPCKGTPSQIGINAHTTEGNPDDTHLEISPRQLAFRFDPKLFRPVKKEATEVTANFTVKFLEYEKEGITLHQPSSVCFTESYIGSTKARLSLRSFQPYLAAQLKDQDPSTAFSALGEENTAKKLGKNRFSGIGRGKGSLALALEKTGDVVWAADEVCAGSQFVSLILRAYDLKQENGRLLFTDQAGKKVNTTESELAEQFKKAGFGKVIVKTDQQTLSIVIHYSL